MSSTQNQMCLWSLHGSYLLAKHPLSPRNRRLLEDDKLMTFPDPIQLRIQAHFLEYIPFTLSKTPELCKSSNGINNYFFHFTIPLSMRSVSSYCTLDAVFYVVLRYLSVLSQEQIIKIKLMQNTQNYIYLPRVETRKKN